MARLKFKSIQGVTGSETTNPLCLCLKGPKELLDKIKQSTTIHNKSAAFQVYKAKETLAFWESRDTTFVDAEVLDKISAKIAAAQATIVENEPLMTQYFHEDHGDWLEVPSGFWWFAETITDGAHLNTLLQPSFVKGLRPYQIECLTEMYKYNRATGCLATGLGKSLLIASLCVATVKAGRRACVVVPTEYLVGQMFDTISQYVHNVMPYGGEHKRLPLGANVLVVTAASAAKFAADYHTIIIDESHHSPASTWVDLLTAAEKATHVYNLTATAFRADGMDLAIHAFGGPVVYERNTRWGIANGWLKPLKAYMVTVKPKRADGSDVIFPAKMPMAKAYGALMKTSEVMDAARKMTLKALKSGRKVIVLFRTVKAGEAFKAVMAKDIEFDVASSAWRKPLDDFRDGKVQILVSNDRLVSEGIDIPEASCLINLIQNASGVITYQAVGRILRKAEGNAIVIDITPEGYDMFTRAQEKRAQVYAAITDDISLVGG